MSRPAEEIRRAALAADCALSRPTLRLIGPAIGAGITVLLAACGTAPPVIERDGQAQEERRAQPSSSQPPAARPPASLPRSSRSGGYYKDDGPGDNPPPDLDNIADAEPRLEPLHRFANNPYVVFGVSYTPMRAHVPFTQRGLASWYGRMFHGQKTSSGEVYDIYAMTAAHPTLPIPSYVLVRHVRNGRSVVVRVNDRGPFHPGRIIDLSFAAAQKLGYVRQGSAMVEVELITPVDMVRRNAPPAINAASVPVAPPALVATVEPVVPSGSAAPSGPVAPPEQPPAAADGSVYVQVGAFSARANAEGLRARIVRELAELRHAAVQVLHGEGAFRVHVGPYRSRIEAATVAERLRQALQLNPLFVTR